VASGLDLSALGSLAVTIAAASFSPPQQGYQFPALGEAVHGEAVVGFLAGQRADSLRMVVALMDTGKMALALQLLTQASFAF